MRSGFSRSAPASAALISLLSFAALLATSMLAPPAARGQAAAAMQPAASAAAPSERARHEADLVFEMIRLQADKPRKSGAAAKDEKGAATVRLRAVARAPGKASETVAIDGPAVQPQLAPVADASVRDVLERAAPAAGPTPLVQLLKPDEGQRPESPASSLPAEPAEPPPAAAAASSRLVAVANPVPTFPSQWLQSLRRGSVEVRFKVQPDGSVAEVEVIATSNRHLNQAALDAVTRWRFEPTARAEFGTVELSFDLDAN